MSDTGASQPSAEAPSSVSRAGTVACAAARSIDVASASTGAATCSRKCVQAWSRTRVGFAIAIARPAANGSSARSERRSAVFQVSRSCPRVRCAWRASRRSPVPPRMTPSAQVPSPSVHVSSSSTSPSMSGSDRNAREGTSTVSLPRENTTGRASGTGTITPRLRALWSASAAALRRSFGAATACRAARFPIRPAASMAASGSGSDASAPAPSCAQATLAGSAVRWTMAVTRSLFMRGSRGARDQRSSRVMTSAPLPTDAGRLVRATGVVKSLPP
jgi:hypothetical protein